MKFFLFSLHNVGMMHTRHMRACAYLCVLFKKKNTYNVTAENLVTFKWCSPPLTPSSK